MKKTVVVAVAAQALEEKGIGHKRAVDLAEHVYESLVSMGALVRPPSDYGNMQKPVQSEASPI